MNPCGPTSPHAGPRLRLVAVVVDDGRVLITRGHDRGIWRLPAAHWPTAENPNTILRDLLAHAAGVVISPVLQTVVRVAPDVWALVFTASPITRPPRPASGATVRWLPLRRARITLPVVDRDLFWLVTDGKAAGRTLIDTDTEVPGAAHR